MEPAMEPVKEPVKEPIKEYKNRSYPIFQTTISHRSESHHRPPTNSSPRSENHLSPDPQPTIESKCRDGTDFPCRVCLARYNHHI